MRRNKVHNLFKLFLKKSSKEVTETFLDLISNNSASYLGLDYLNCFLVSYKKQKIPDNNINFILEFDIIKKYSPTKRTDK